MHAGLCRELPFMPGMLAAPILPLRSLHLPHLYGVVLDQPSRQSCLAVQDKPITESVHFTTAMVGFTMLAIQGSLTKLFAGQNAQVARTAHAFFGTATMGLFLFHASQVLQMCHFSGVYSCAISSTPPRHPASLAHPCVRGSFCLALPPVSLFLGCCVSLCRALRWGSRCQRRQPQWCRLRHLPPPTSLPPCKPLGVLVKLVLPLHAVAADV